jgi:hypothetical protein
LPRIRLSVKLYGLRGGGGGGGWRCTARHGRSHLLYVLIAGISHEGRGYALLRQALHGRGLTRADYRAARRRVRQSAG